MIDRRNPTLYERLQAFGFWVVLAAAVTSCTVLMLAMLEVRQAEREVKSLKAQLDSQWNELHISRCQTQGGEPFVESGELRCFTRKGKLLWKEEWK